MVQIKSMPTYRTIALTGDKTITIASKKGETVTLTEGGIKYSASADVANRRPYIIKYSPNNVVIYGLVTGAALTASEQAYMGISPAMNTNPNTGVPYFYTHEDGEENIYLQDKITLENGEYIKITTTNGNSNDAVTGTFKIINKRTKFQEL